MTVPIATVRILSCTEDLFTARSQVIFDVNLKVPDIKKGTIQTIFFRYTVLKSDVLTTRFGPSSSLTETNQTPEWIRKKFPNVPTFEEFKKIADFIGKNRK
jgi:hypothetical protein